jgi:hypothetical protein
MPSPPSVFFAVSPPNGPACSQGASCHPKRRQRPSCRSGVPALGPPRRRLFRHLYGSGVPLLHPDRPRRPARKRDRRSRCLPPHRLWATSARRSGHGRWRGGRRCRSCRGRGSAHGRLLFLTPFGTFTVCPLSPVSAGYSLSEPSCHPARLYVPSPRHLPTARRASAGVLPRPRAGMLFFATRSRVAG